MSSGLYAVGYLILLGGIAYLAYLMKIPQTYIVALVVILVGVGILRGAQSMGRGGPK